jgi:hypothetical protein
LLRRITFAQEETVSVLQLIADAFRAQKIPRVRQLIITFAAFSTALGILGTITQVLQWLIGVF